MVRFRFNALAVGILMLASLPVHAHHTPEHSAAMGDPVAPVAATDLAVSECWVRLMPAQVPSAAYFKINNKSASAAQLRQVATDAYGSVMMHATTQTGGMSRMSMARDVTIPARGALAFEPGGYHVMLSKPARKIEIGDTLDMTLLFAGNVRVNVPCRLREPSALAP